MQSQQQINQQQSQQKINRQQLESSWQKTYQKIKNNYTSKDKTSLTFGIEQQYESKQVGQHYLIKNINMKNKTQKALITETSAQLKIVYPFHHEKFHFGLLNGNQILFFVNFENNTIETHLHTDKQMQLYTDRLPSSVKIQDMFFDNHTHPIKINAYPLCRTHCLFAPFINHKYPQVLSFFLLKYLFRIFNIFPEIKVGYNSLGGGATVNHFHFHLLYSQNLINSSKMPIEQITNKKLLKALSFSTEIFVQQINNDLFFAFIISNKQQKYQFSKPQQINDICKVSFIIIKHLQLKNIPYNLLITNNKTIYIMIRNFSLPSCSLGWLEFSGVILAKSQSEYDINQNQIYKIKNTLLFNNLEKNNISERIFHLNYDEQML